MTTKEKLESLHSDIKYSEQQIEKHKFEIAKCENMLSIVYNSEAKKRETVNPEIYDLAKKDIEELKNTFGGKNIEEDNFFAD